MPVIEQILSERFARAIATVAGEEQASTDPLIRVSTNPAFGDFQANVAMSLGKSLGRKPRELAQELVEALDWQGLTAVRPEVAGPGFINLRLADELLHRCLAEMAVDDRVGVPPDPQACRVVVDYSAPNVAKEMHVGHLRSTVIGDCLVRVLGLLGYDVVRQNHIGDWGTQFGMLIEHLVDEGWEPATAHTVSDLNALYQQAKSKFDADLGFQERARQRVVMLQGGDEATIALWRALIDESKRHFSEIYRHLDVFLTDADIAPESGYNAQLDDVVAELERLGLTRESAGALCIFPPGFTAQDGSPLPLIIRKKDGGYLYATTDLAALRHRLRAIGAKRIAYVTDARQRQHFAMVFRVAEMAGWIGPDVRLEHVPFGTILGEDNRPFKTRAGGTVRLADLLAEAEERAAAIVAAKNPELDPASRAAVAHAVGIGAAKYADLSNDRVKDYVFSWDRMLSFQGNTAPYLQNAYVRIRSIFRKAAERGIPSATPDELRLQHPSERQVGLALLRFAGVVAQVGASLEPHRLCVYLYELASAYHQFYEECPVLAADDQGQRGSRLALSELVARVLARGLDLLGIQVVERM